MTNNNKTFGTPRGRTRLTTPTAATDTATSSFEASKKGRLSQIAAAQRLIDLGAEGVASAEEAAKASEAEIRSQAAKALASQFQTAGRRAAGGGVLASLGQSSRDTARAITSQSAQDKLRIQAAKESAAQTQAEQAQKIADLEDVQGAAEDRFAAIKAGIDESTTLGFGDIQIIEQWQAALKREADPVVRQMIQDEIDSLGKDVGFVEKGANWLFG